MILRLGLYLGFDFWVCSISACNLSRMVFAIALPSILVAVIAGEVEENAFVKLFESVAGSEIEQPRTLLPHLVVIVLVEKVR